MTPSQDPYATKPPDTRSPDPPVGRVAAPAGADLPLTIGRFRVLERLGAGAFGTVYRCHDPQVDREVALKIPQPGVLGSPAAIERFLREAKAAGQLRHPHIVPVYEAGRDDGQYYIVSAFIPGRTLAAAVDRPLEFPRAARIVRHLAEALAYAHRRAVVHRDVKPANVMLDDEDQPLVMDFGLAHRQDLVGKLTQEGAILGTPAYMAPEQAEGKSGDPVPASDQYSLGVVLYELLCGELPFTGPLQVVLFNIMHQQPPSPRKFNPKVSRDLETICLTAMAKRPQNRYIGCQEMADDLRRWLDGEPIRARRVGLAERLVRWYKREPKLAAAVTVAGVSLTLLMLASLSAAVFFWSVKKAAEEQLRMFREAESPIVDARPDVPHIIVPEGKLVERKQVLVKVRMQGEKAVIWVENRVVDDKEISAKLKGYADEGRKDLVIDGGEGVPRETIVFIQITATEAGFRTFLEVHPKAGGR